MSILDTAEYRRLALIAAGVDPCDIPCILDTAAWRRLMLKALYDLSQGGGGSPGYINGSVQFYTDLPVTVGTPAVNTAYLVRENSGVWFINRKPAGIYVRLFNNGNLNDWDYAGTFPEVNDAQYFRIYDSADPTREVAFNVSGVAAATTRTLTVPNANGTIALTSDIPPAFNPASPGPIGNVTPAAGTFTNLVANTELQLPSAAPASPSAGDLYRNANTLRYRDSTNTERLLLNATDNLSNLTNTATARANLGLGTSDNVTFGSIQNTPIGSTTRNSGAFTTLNATNGTLTASAPVLDLAQTWNNAAVTFTGLTFSVTNTASAATSRVFNFLIGGTSRMAMNPSGDVLIGTSLTLRGDGLVNSGLAVICGTNVGINNNDLRMRSALPIQWSSTSSMDGTADLFLRREAAGTLSQYNLANPQAFRLYNTTDAGLTNFERGFMRWSSNVLQIGTEKGGTGSARALEFQTDGTTRFTLSTTGAATFTSTVTANGTSNGFETSSAPNGASPVRFSADSGNVLIQTALNPGITEIRGTTATNPQTVRIFNTRTSSTNFERLNIRWASNECIIDAEAGSGGGTLRGIKIGSATTQPLGFWNATPAAQPAAVADATDAASTQARLNDLLARLRTIGIIAT